MSLIKVTNLSKKYRDFQAIKSVNFELRTNQCIALIGPNGAGKTTILNMLAGILPPTAGTIKWQMETEGHHTDWRQYIGYLPQYPAFYPWMTGREFLLYVGRLAHMSKDTVTTEADKLLGTLGLDAAKNKRIATYSGGMKQRLGIAQAIIHRPALLILDEPVASLDPMGRREILTLMEDLKKDMTILFSTHILRDADEISDHLLLLNKGKIVQSGSIRDLEKNYQPNKIVVSFAENTAVYADQIQHLPGVSTCTVKQQTLEIETNQMEQARKEILSYIANHELALTTFTVNQLSLEELFMKVVNV